MCPMDLNADGSEMMRMKPGNLQHLESERGKEQYWSLATLRARGFAFDTVILLCTSL